MRGGTLVIAGGFGRSANIAKEPPAANTDKRYGTMRWRRLAKAVLNRDMHRCRIVPGCPVTATVADHIQPVFVGMPDALFYDPRNLRASCKRHNLRRGVAARFVRETEGRDTVTRDYTRPDDVA